MCERSMCVENNLKRSNLSFHKYFSFHRLVQMYESSQKNQHTHTTEITKSHRHTHSGSRTRARINEISGNLPEHCLSVFGSVPDWHQWGPLATGSQPQSHPTMTADQRVFHCKKRSENISISLRSIGISESVGSSFKINGCSTITTKMSCTTHLKWLANGRASSKRASLSKLSLQTRSAWVRMVFSLFLMSSASSLVVSRNILLHLSMVSLTAVRLLSRSSWKL